MYTITYTDNTYLYYQGIQINYVHLHKQNIGHNNMYTVIAH